MGVGQIFFFPIDAPKMHLFPLEAAFRKVFERATVGKARDLVAQKLNVLLSLIARTVLHCCQVEAVS